MIQIVVWFWLMQARYGAGIALLYDRRVPDCWLAKVDHRVC